MIVSIILLSLGVIASAAFIYSKVTNYTLNTIILKGLASLFFVVLGVYLAITVEGHFLYKLFIALGLFFGFLGDVFLGFKYITTKTKKFWILAGMFAFAAGHIFYIVALFPEYYVMGNWLFILLPFATASLLTVIYLIIFKKVGVNFGSLMPFGVFYLFCLSMMVSTAFYMSILHKFSIINLSIFLGGAVFFAASDTMLSGAYFRAGKRSKPYMAIYSVFYYIAQFAIAFALFFLV